MIKGLATSRNPQDGSKQIVGFYIVDGEQQDREIHNLPQLPKLSALLDRLEAENKDAVEVEFTIDNKNNISTDTVKPLRRKGLAAVRIAVELVDSGILTKQEAIQRVQKFHLDEILYPVFKNIGNYKPMGRGTPAAAGAAVGIACLDAADAIAQHSKGQQVILVREETNPEDVAGMKIAQGVLAAKGGITSHAAIVCRGWGKPCVVGGNFNIADIKPHTWVSINGATGEFYNEKLEIISAAEDSIYFRRFMEFCDL